jgi:hypothetical protein
VGCIESTTERAEGPRRRSCVFDGWHVSGSAARIWDVVSTSAELKGSNLDGTTREKEVVVNAFPDDGTHSQITFLKLVTDT